MRVPKVLPIALSLLLAVGSAGAAFCSDTAFTRLDKIATDAYSEGDFKKAQSQWNKLLERLNFVLVRNDDTTGINEQIETTLRHLGECALGQKNYDSADDYLRQAKTASVGLKQADPDLDRDFKELAINYRLIDLAHLGDLGIVGPIVTAALSEFHPNKVSVSKMDKGHHVSVALADDVIKDIGAKGVTQVGVNKNMSFDLIQGEGGEITLANISGIKVHAGFWVNIINSSLKLDQSQHPVALVTAQKMGISQSVSTPVPDMIYLPVVGIVSQVKTLFGEESSQPQTILARPASDNNGAVPASATGPQAEGTGMVPVTNTTDPATAGAVMPIPPATGQSDVSAGYGQSPAQPLPTMEATQASPTVPIVPVLPNVQPATPHLN